MIHLYFLAPWDKLLKQKRPMCQILNPVAKCIENQYKVCIGCLAAYDEGMVVWREAKKKEKK